jgi:hypothetical protein
MHVPDPGNTLTSLVSGTGLCWVRIVCIVFQVVVLYFKSLLSPFRATGRCNVIVPLLINTTINDTRPQQYKDWVALSASVDSMNRESRVHVDGVRIPSPFRLKNLIRSTNNVEWISVLAIVYLLATEYVIEKKLTQRFTHRFMSKVCVLPYNRQ